MLARLIDRLRGNAPSLPPMDGPYRPNRLVDDAECVGRGEKPDNLAHFQGQVVFSEGGNIRTLGGDVLFDFPATITAVATDGNGGIAVALAGGEVVRRAADGSTTALHIPGSGEITALAYDARGTLLATRGAEAAPISGWTRALLTGDSSGSAWRLGTDGAIQLASDLHWPAGIVALGEGVAISEANALRVIEIASGGRHNILVDDLPGYPSRLTGDGSGGFLIALMAPRNPLLEFILTEKAYCERMVREVAEIGWIAPRLQPPGSFLEPMQQGAQRSLGVLKPWAPSFSLGLLLRVDAGFRPMGLAASRASGVRHGMRSVLADQGRVLASSLASGEIVSLQPFGGVL